MPYSQSSLPSFPNKFSQQQLDLQRYEPASPLQIPQRNLQIPQNPQNPLNHELTSPLASPTHVPLDYSQQDLSAVLFGAPVDPVASHEYSFGAAGQPAALLSTSWSGQAGGPDGPHFPLHSAARSLSTSQSDLAGGLSVETASSDVVSESEFDGGDMDLLMSPFLHPMSATPGFLDYTLRADYEPFQSRQSQWAPYYSQFGSQSLTQGLSDLNSQGVSSQDQSQDHSDLSTQDSSSLSQRLSQGLSQNPSYQDPSQDITPHGSPHRSPTQTSPLQTSPVQPSHQDSLFDPVTHSPPSESAHVPRDTSKCGILALLMANPTMWKQATLSKKGTYVCSHCTSQGKPQKFSNLAALAAHFDHHEVTRLCKCDYSNCVWSLIGFSSMPEKVRHLRSQHSNKHYKCAACQRAFLRGDSLKRHLRLVHGRENTTAAEINEMTVMRPFEPATATKPYEPVFLSLTP
ncbi:hypothetical protein CKK34_0707 [Yarrowia sp. E02]|nr:hypothetical protein CKK34_0707 [Yarrowia sp. E02]